MTSRSAHAGPASHRDEVVGDGGNEELIVIGRSGPLNGEVSIPGAKNSVLKLMAATLLADGMYTLTNVPDIIDVQIMSELLAALGIATCRREPGVIVLDNRGLTTPVAPYELVERIRASINVLGPLLGRFGRVTLSLPGGDDFGERPIDMHVRGLEAMGAEFVFGESSVRATARRLNGAAVTLEFPSVGATENILTAAVHAKGTTVIDNAAREPEIADLCAMLTAMGADIEGVGSGTLVIQGCEPGSLRSTDHEVVVDRVQAATYIAATAIVGGDVSLRGARHDHMETLLRRFREMGLSITESAAGIAVSAPSPGDRRLHSIDVATLPYPGVATDYKPLITTLLSVADGVGIVTENLYPGRFRYVEELQRLGADIRTEGHHAVVRGVARLHGAAVRAPDIRAGAALVVAGLSADGETLLSGVHHVDRGYDDLVGRLSSLGAVICRRPA
ncbi:MAG: UDP-N-acetylglucosamine 1-carboxyvinyltransferase [Ilumatobacteraceae bacterium]